MSTHRLNIDLPVDTHHAVKVTAEEMGIHTKGLICMTAMAIQDIPPTRMNEALAALKKFSDPNRAAVRSGQLEMV